MNGLSTAQIRQELGEEVFINHNISRVDAPDYTRADALVRILDWRAFANTAIYDHAVHDARDPALAEG
jgi:hypothetical protein